MLDKMMNLVNAMVAAGDAAVVRQNGVYDVVIYDWDGFDDDWDEVMRDYADEAAVDAFLDWYDTNRKQLAGLVRVHFESENI